MAFPADYNFKYYRGDTYEFYVFPKLASGAPFDLGADYVPKMVISSGLAGSGAPEMEAVTEKIETAPGVFAGVKCTISSSLGSTLSGSTTYYYDVEARFGSIVYTFLKGEISVVNGVGA